MIAKLTGIVDHVGADGAVIDVGGVGYLVFCLGPHACASCAAGRRRRRCWSRRMCARTHIPLYGFLETAERDWFRLLTTVQGVGARLALSILSTLAPDELARAIAAQDKREPDAAPAGVGPKLAARIVTELKDKAAAFGVGAAAARASDGAGGAGRLGHRGRGLGAGQSRLSPRRGLRRGGARRRSGSAPRRRLDALIRAGLQELAR